MHRSAEVTTVRRIIALAALLVMVLLFANTALASAEVFGSSQSQLDGRQISAPVDAPSNQAAQALFIAIAGTAVVGWVSYGGYRLHVRLRPASHEFARTRRSGTPMLRRTA